MNSNHLIIQLSTILVGEDLKRIRIEHMQIGLVLTVDVHGLSCRTAKKFVNNIVNLTMGTITIEVIHGYRHGTKIKDMLRLNYSNPYITRIEADTFNKGITYLYTCLTA